MEEIVIARSSRTAVVFGTLVLIWAGPFALLVGWRISRMKLVVTSTSVVLVNFFKQHEFTLDEVRIHDNKVRDPGQSDAGGPMDTDGRLLSLSDGTGKRVHVGVAPTSGSRLDIIAEDLYRAIDRMQAGLATT